MLLNSLLVASCTTFIFGITGASCDRMPDMKLIVGEYSPDLVSYISRLSQLKAHQRAALFVSLDEVSVSICFVRR